MVRHVVPINTIKSSIHAVHAHAHAPPPAPTPPAASPAFGEHRRISSIPGSRTAAAFLTSLSVNLTLPDADSPFPSPMSTPPSMRASGSRLPPPSPLASAVTVAAADNCDAGPADMLSPYAAAAAPPRRQCAPADALDGVPELVTEQATTEEDKVAALKLVADSIAQQRQAASWALISHPAALAGYVLALAVMHHYMYKSPADLPLLFTTGAGITMALLVAVRMVTARYIALAEGLNWSFLDEDVDAVMVTRFGEQIIAALVLGWAGPSVTGNKAARRRKGRGVVKAWTVKLKYRGKGVGTALLEEAVKETVKRGGEGVEFSDEHANSARILPTYFNRSFDRREALAHAALQAIVNASGAFSGRKRKSSVY